jgi:endo-1,4-beta-mannosidase
MDSYLESQKKSILIESLSVQGNKTTNFLAMISGREDRVVVRLYPKVEVEKTDGVKKTIGELAKQLLETFPDFKLKETNLREYLA